MSRTGKPALSLKLEAPPEISGLGTSLKLGPNNTKKEVQGPFLPPSFHRAGRPAVTLGPHAGGKGAQDRGISYPHVHARHV